MFDCTENFVMWKLLQWRTLSKLHPGQAQTSARIQSEQNRLKTWNSEGTIRRLPTLQLGGTVVPRLCILRVWL